MMMENFEICQTKQMLQRAPQLFMPEWQVVDGQSVRGMKAGSVAIGR